MKFLMITNNPAVAAFAVSAGVNRIFVDLEMLGKEKRQGHLNTVISRHVLEDIARVRPAVPPGGLLVRINPIHEGSQDEIDAVIAAGGDILMLPMFHGPAEVEVFTKAVAGRARSCLLVETIGAAESLRACVRVPGVDEVHIGLNDLHLELKLRFMFEPLASGLVDQLASVLRSEGVPFGIGGVARVGEGMLPAELLLAEHVRLGSTGAILSRTFHRQSQTVEEIEGTMDFPLEVQRLRDAFATHGASAPEMLHGLHVELQQRVAQIVAAIQTKASAGRAGV